MPAVMSSIGPSVSAPALVGGGSGLTPAVRIGADHEVWREEKQKEGIMRSSQ